MNTLKFSNLQKIQITNQNFRKLSRQNDVRDASCCLLTPNENCGLRILDDGLCILMLLCRCRCLPDQNLNLVVELQANSTEDSDDPTQLFSKGWTKIDLFDISNRLLSGRYKLNS